MVQKKVKKVLFFSAGIISFALGIIGAFLPIMPTVPFILLSAFCFSKSSHKIHDWMIGHPKMGPHIISWRDEGIIPLKVKHFVTVVVPISFAFTFSLVQIHIAIEITLVVIATGVLLFIWSRPHQSTKSPSDNDLD